MNDKSSGKQKLNLFKTINEDHSESSHITELLQDVFENEMKLTDKTDTIQEKEEINVSNYDELNIEEKRKFA